MTEKKSPENSPENSPEINDEDFGLEERELEDREDNQLAVIGEELEPFEDDEVISTSGVCHNARTVAFLEKWDRNVPPERRRYGIKFLFAGAEGHRYREGLYRIGARHILLSYYYLRGALQRLSYQELAEDLGRFDFVFLDSGGFTFRVMAEKGQAHGMSLREYADEFYSEMRRLKGLFSAVAELDVDDLGQDYMERAKEEAQADGVPIVPVMQPPDLQKYIDLGWFEKYPYIAIGSAAFGAKNVGFVERAYQEAQKHGVILHGLAATSVDLLTKSFFYSVDSTTWLNGTKYGATQIFQNGRIRHYDAAAQGVRKRYRKMFEENGIRWEDAEAGNHMEMTLVNAVAWRQLSDYMQYNTLRSYWLTPEEKDEALSLRAKSFGAEDVVDRPKSLARAEFRRLSQVDNADYDDRAHELLHCDTCHMTGRCPRYKKGETCGYDINIRLETMADFQRAVQVILETEYGRVMTGSLFEKLDGGQLDKNLSNEMQTFLNMLQQAQGIFSVRPEQSLTITATSKGHSGEAGGVAAMLASVLSPKGTGGSGSGNTPTQRAAGRVIDVEPE